LDIENTPKKINCTIYSSFFSCEMYLIW
jgi:hypothetical protein